MKNFEQIPIKSGGFT